MQYEMIYFLTLPRAQKKINKQINTETVMSILKPRKCFDDGVNSIFSTPCISIEHAYFFFLFNFWILCTTHTQSTTQPLINVLCILAHLFVSWTLHVCSPRIRLNFQFYLSHCVRAALFQWSNDIGKCRLKGKQNYIKSYQCRGAINVYAHVTSLLSLMRTPLWELNEMNRVYRFIFYN